MERRRLVAHVVAASVTGAAVLATTASAQLPVPLDATVVPIAPEVRDAAFPSVDYGNTAKSADDKSATTTWRVVEATGNCCENYLTTSSGGRLYDFGGTYVNFTDDRGLTWKSVRTITPLVNGEGTIAMAPGGDVIGVGWDPYSGDHLQAFKYEADTGRWQYTETPLHQPFYDREWVAVVPGPFTIDGKTVEYITFLKGGWPSKEAWYYSTDGLNYTQVSSKFVDKTLSGAAPRAVATSTRADADWIQPNTNGGMTPLGNRGVLASGDYVVLSGPSNAWSLFDGEQWVPATLADGSTPSGVFQVDSHGRLHNVIPDGNAFTYRWSADNGATWKSLDLRLPDGLVFEEWDFRANRAAGVAAVLVHAQDTVFGADADVVFKIGIGPKYAAPQLLRRYTVGNGDVNSTAGVGSNVRMDFQTVTIFPDGRLAVSFLDSTTNTTGATGSVRFSPAVAIEGKTKLRGPVPEEEPPVVGTAQSPMSGTVVVPGSGAGQARVWPVTSARFEFVSDANADNGGGLVVEATPLLPADIDLYLQRQLVDGSWSGDLSSGTSGALDFESLTSGRLLPGSRYRIEAHNWLGAPTTVDLSLRFFNSAGVEGQ
jgi:hypothetical protein